LNPAFNRVEITGIRAVAADTYVLTYADEAGASSILPGQFCMLSPSPGASCVYLPRPFSYFRSMEDGRVEILFRALGRGTRWMAGLKPGDRVGIYGPLGRPFQAVSGISHAVLVAGGVGLPPLAMLAGQLLKQKNPPAVDLLYGETLGQRVIDLDGILPLGVRLRVATEDGSKGYHGRVTGLLLDEVLPGTAAPLAVFTCGPRAMMAALADILRTREVRSFQASLEENMACGNGICMGCAVELASDGDQPYYKLCCKDGPVFNGFEVKWR
jgi:dihydroorotate dehydrogenase electron transfer subunit